MLIRFVRDVIGVNKEQLVSAEHPLPVSPTSVGGAAMVQGLTREQLDAAAVKTEPLGRLGLAQQITAGASASTTLALSAGVTRLRITVRNANVHVSIGTGSQAATSTSGTTSSHFFQADTSTDVACLAGSQISVMRGTDQTVDGIVHVSELI